MFHGLYSRCSPHIIPPKPHSSLPALLLSPPLWLPSLPPSRNSFLCPWSCSLLLTSIPVDILALAAGGARKSVWMEGYSQQYIMWFFQGPSSEKIPIKGFRQKGMAGHPRTFPDLWPENETVVGKTQKWDDGPLPYHEFWLSQSLSLPVFLMHLNFFSQASTEEHLQRESQCQINRICPILCSEWGSISEVPVAREVAFACSLFTPGPPCQHIWGTHWPAKPGTRGPEAGKKLWTLRTVSPFKSIP